MKMKKVWAALAVAVLCTIGAFAQNSIPDHIYSNTFQLNNGTHFQLTFSMFDTEPDEFNNSYWIADFLFAYENGEEYEYRYYLDKLSRNFSSFTISTLAAFDETVEEKGMWTEHDEEDLPEELLEQLAQDEAGTWTISRERDPSDGYYIWLSKDGSNEKYRLWED